MNRLLAAAFSLAILAIPAVSHAAGDQDFALKNKTGYQIDDVYISRHSASEWGDDIMGKGNVLEDGDTTNITFRERARGCHWDLKVMYHDHTTAEWSDLNLCEIEKVTLHYDAKSDTTSAEFD